MVARLVDAFCEETEYNQRAAVAEALAVVALPCLEAVLGTVLNGPCRALQHAGVEIGPRESAGAGPPPGGARLGQRARPLGGGVRLARVSIREALPHLLDALRRAPTPLLQPVVAALQWAGQEAAEALPLLRDLPWPA